MAQLNSKIHEVIIGTLNENGNMHYAPMGTEEVGAHILIQPFKPSATYENLKRHRQCTINYTDDVRVFAGALTGHRDWESHDCDKIKGGYLAQALSHSELQVAEFIDGDPRTQFHCKIVHNATHAPFRGFNRAQSAVIEAAVLTSRLNMLPPEKIQQEIAYLQIAIEKTAGERELAAWGWLMETIKVAGIALD